MDLRAGAVTHDRQGGVSLVIGGTGMLAEATRWLAVRSARTLLVSRRADQFAPADKTITPLVTDWNGGDFHEVLSKALAKYEAIRRALLWLHEPEPILPWLLPLISDARVVVVLGSMDGNPQVPAFADLVTVRLGSIATAHGCRWLTHEEISNGAIQALTDGWPRIAGALGAP